MCVERGPGDSELLLTRLPLMPSPVSFCTALCLLQYAACDYGPAPAF